MSKNTTETNTELVETDLPVTEETELTETEAAQSLEEYITDAFNSDKEFKDGKGSPYGMHRVVNKILSETETGAQLVPQMFYSYTSKGPQGMIKADKTGAGRKVTTEEAIRWTVKYYTKHFTSATETE